MNKSLSEMLFPLFLLVLIVNLFWAVQFVAEIKSETTVICLNFFMPFFWVLFVLAYCKVQKTNTENSYVNLLAGDEGGETEVPADRNDIEMPAIQSETSQ